MTTFTNSTFEQEEIRNRRRSERERSSQEQGSTFGTATAIIGSMELVKFYIWCEIGTLTRGDLELEE